MADSFDFGFEDRTVPWDTARVAILFASGGSTDDFGAASGTLAVADASRYAEFFEIQDGTRPLASGVCSEICWGEEPLVALATRMRAARAAGKLPIAVGVGREVTAAVCVAPLVALWGVAGRGEPGEATLVEKSGAMLLGLRAATAAAAKSLPPRLKPVTSREIATRRREVVKEIGSLEGPVHLSLDLDVLTPGTALQPRVAEPGGLSWYDVVDLLERLFRGPGVAAVDLVGCGEIQPRSPAALLAAQLLIKMAGLAGGPRS